MPVPLSVLDVAPVTAETGASGALRNSLNLAVLADRLGYARYWLAERHGLASFASAAPAVLIGQAAALTKRIRVGAGGIALPNTAPLAVAESFRTLEALFPGRIDLGVDRASGADALTALALRRGQAAAPDDGGLVAAGSDGRGVYAEGGDDVLDRLHELLAFGTGRFPEGHPFRRVLAMPTDAELPPVWLLGSSVQGATLAASMGLGFAFAHPLGARDTVAALRAYRQGFRPSAARGAPAAILGVSVVCAETDAEAGRLAATLDLAQLRLARGELTPLLAPDEARAAIATDVDRAEARANRARHVVGGPATVRDQVLELAGEAGADEVMVATTVYDHRARRRSYELLAEAFGLGG